MKILKWYHRGGKFGLSDQLVYHTLRTILDEMSEEENYKINESTLLFESNILPNEGNENIFSDMDLIIKINLQEN